MNCNQNFKISQVTNETLVLGIDVGSSTHYARAFDWRGLELSKIFKFKNSFEGFQSFLSWVNDLCCKNNKNKVIAEIKGIGIATAISFVAEVGDIRRFKSAKQVQKYAGLALKENSSGKHKGLTRISKRGRKKLRTILFRATIPLIGFNKEFSSIYNYYIERKDNPLKKNQALTAICCKMIRIFFTILSKGIKYDETKMIQDIKRPIVA